MSTIEQVHPDEEFFECVHALTELLDIRFIMLTGGEPTLHPELFQIINGINVADMSITTNGIRLLTVDEWTQLRDAGLHKVVVSIHDATPQAYLQLETRQHRFGWAARALEAQRQNIVTACEAGLQLRVNTVAHSSKNQVMLVFEMLEDLQQQYQFEIRLLNDLANICTSQNVIGDVCQSLDARVGGEERRAGSSNVTVYWETESGFCFSTKMACAYYFDPICTDCSLKEQCYEGFYGIRIERKKSSYWVRLCLYKHSADVLMPWESFLCSTYASRLIELCRHEQT